jgi:ATP synthase F1 complex assembly factor 2
MWMLEKTRLNGQASSWQGDSSERKGAWARGSTQRRSLLTPTKKSCSIEEQSSSHTESETNESAQIAMMKAPAQTALRLPLRLIPGRPILAPSSTILCLRHIHSTPATPATVSPIHGNGPPPEAPLPAANSIEERLARRKRQADMLRAARDIRAAQKPTAKSKAKAQNLPKRFWKDVHVHEVDGAFEVHLDKRKLRHPTTKLPVRVPLSKPMLAHAVALEWDMLVTTQQATHQYLIPLTSLVCRALDIVDDDAAAHAKSSTYEQETIRAGIAKTVLRYLDTDTLLCWAPPPQAYDIEEGVESLRDVQKRTAEEILGYLTSRIWPGVEIEPVLDGESIMPKNHSEVTKKIVEGWVMGLNPWDLAGLERGVLAGKGLLTAVRLLVEWSESYVGTGVDDGGAKKFGIEEAAKVANLETDWQTQKWGEVEDTHDVEKEDLRRQLGSLVLIVSGTRKR